MFDRASKLLGRRSPRGAPADSLSTFLFPKPSFLSGMARALDFGNTLTEYNRSRNPEEADALALRADLRAVGRDMRMAIERVSSDPRVIRSMERRVQRQAKRDRQPHSGRRKPVRAT